MTKLFPHKQDKIPQRNDTKTFQICRQLSADSGMQGWNFGISDLMVSS